MSRRSRLALGLGLGLGLGIQESTYHEDGLLAIESDLGHQSRHIIHNCINSSKLTYKASESNHGTSRVVVIYRGRS